jgi:hypothetical protein
MALQESILILKDIFIDRLDYTLAYTGITVLVYFYGLTAIRRILQPVRAGKLQKFIIFILIILFGVNLLSLFMISYIVSLKGALAKWGIISLILVGSFVVFDFEILRKR